MSTRGGRVGAGGSRRRFFSGSSLVLGMLAALGCGKPASNEPTPVTKDSASREVRSVPSPSASVVTITEKAPALVETWVFEPVANLKTADGLYAIENALLASADHRIGRIVDDEGTLEWIGKVPGGGGAFGTTLIVGISGVSPDAIDVRYQNNNGRAPEPTYFPLSGKGHSVITGEGGMYGYIFGLARVGETTLLGTYARETGQVLRTVRGPKLARTFTTPKDAGCQPGEVDTVSSGPPPKAVLPDDLAGNERGELFSVGPLCEKRERVVERWDATGKASILPIPWKTEKYQRGRFLRGKGDKLWLFGGSTVPMFEYRDGAFVALAATVPGPGAEPFVSLEGELFVATDTGIFQLNDAKTSFEPVARFRFPKSIGAVAKSGRVFWAQSGGKVGKLVKGESIESRADCPTPFVYLYDVSPSNEATFTFPTTQKALAKFPDRAAITLVESVLDGRRRLGVTVTNNAQGEALIAHLATAMKDEHPRLLCYRPENPRVIGAATKKP
jgi:hypothetical protein